MAQGYIRNSNSNKKTVIVPDVHGRLDFVIEVFYRYPIEDWDIVFSGDILHTETDGHRWKAITDEFVKTRCFGQDMLDELEASHGSHLIIDGMRKNNPDSVFVVRGNHDDVAERLVGSYGKFSHLGESSLYAAGLKHFFRAEYQAYLQYEKTIPYIYIGNGFIVSHTVPQRAYTLDQVICDNSKVHQDFTWTDNREQRGPWTGVFTKNLETLGEGQAKFWFIGHRPVEPNHVLRIQMNKRLVQNNNPKKWVVVEFDPAEQNYKAVELCSQNVNM
jgi:hypothetical protein